MDWWIDFEKNVLVNTESGTFDKLRRSQTGMKYFFNKACIKQHGLID